VRELALIVNCRCLVVQRVAAPPPTAPRRAGG
jgi:hypothetical protein